MLAHGHAASGPGTRRPTPVPERPGTGLLLPRSRWVCCAAPSQSHVGEGHSRVTEFYRQYLAVALLFGTALLMVGAMLGVGRLLRPKRPQSEKYLTYEAGSDPVGGWGQSNVRYYVYALLFVIFDVEAVFIFPWAVNLEPLGVFGLVEMIVFIVILALGLVYAWRKGVLRWA